MPFPNQPTVVISKSNSAAHVVDRALGIWSSVTEPVEEEDESDSVLDLVQPRKRRKTSLVWQHGNECVVKDDITGKSYQGFQCRHCKWVAK